MRILETAYRRTQPTPCSSRVKPLPPLTLDAVCCCPKNSEHTRPPSQPRFHPKSKSQRDATGGDVKTANEQKEETSRRRLAAFLRGTTPSVGGSVGSDQTPSTAPPGGVLHRHGTSNTVGAVGGYEDDVG